MRWPSAPRWLLPIAQVTGVIGLGILLTWLVVEEVGVKGGAVAVTCLLLPALVALAFSDRLSEISAGGVTAKFRKAGKRPVKSLAVKAEAYFPAVKGSPEELDHWLDSHADDYLRPIVLELRLHRSYSERVFETYLRSISEIFPRFAFVVIADQEGAHVCHVPAGIVLAWLDPRHEKYGRESSRRLYSFLNHVQRGDTRALLRIPGVLSETVTQSARLADALRTMNRAKQETFLVVDQQKHPRGVLELATVMSELLLAIIR